MNRWAGDTRVISAALGASLALMLATTAAGGRSSTLPPDLIHREGTQIDAFDSLIGLALSVGRLTADQEHRHEGAGSLGVQTAPGGKGSRRRRSFSTAL